MHSPESILHNCYSFFILFCFFNLFCCILPLPLLQGSHYLSVECILFERQLYSGYVLASDRSTCQRLKLSHNKENDTQIPLSQLCIAAQLCHMKLVDSSRLFELLLQHYKESINRYDRMHVNRSSSLTHSVSLTRIPIGQYPRLGHEGSQLFRTTEQLQLYKKTTTRTS